MKYEPLDIPVVWAAVPCPKYEVWIGFDSLHGGEGGQHQHFRGVATVVARLTHPRVRCVRSRKIGISKTVKRKVYKKLKTKIYTESGGYLFLFLTLFLSCFTALRHYFYKNHYIFYTKVDAQGFYQQSLRPVSVLIIECRLRGRVPTLVEPTHSRSGLP